MGDDTWGHESGTGWDWLDQRADYSKSWASANLLQDFLLKNGGRQDIRIVHPQPDWY